MTWSLNASGHTPQYGATSSHFAGNHVSGNTLHLPQDAPGVEHVREHGQDGGTQVI